SLLIISGAFGLFKRSLVEEVGGYDTATVGEDMELVMRLHRHLRKTKVPYKITFVPDPVCWTECPESLRTLRSQRRRWHRGLAEALWRHRAASLDPRQGAFGLLGIPYFIAFEALGPIIELLGYIVFPIGYFTGTIETTYVVAFLILAGALGIALSVAALLLEEVTFRRYERRRDVLKLFLYAVLENVGYRQLTSWWRVRAFVDVARRRRSWGEMQRKGFASRPTVGPTRGPSS
ncbi:MAG: glycosyltransferase, partial [Actinomycetota bacterium]